MEYAARYAAPFDQGAVSRVRLTIACLLVVCAAGGSDLPVNYVAGPLIELNDNGAWSWFMDERAIVDDDKLIVGSVRAGRPLRGGKVTYSRRWRPVPGGMVGFWRGVGLEASYVYSDGSGRSWHYGGRRGHGTSGGYTPYLKYACDGVATIHFVMTENR